YLKYVGGLVQGDLGMSYHYPGRSVLDLLDDGVGVSFSLGLTALIVSLCAGIPIGVFAALKQNSILDRGVMVVMLALFAIPSFVLIPVFRWINFQFYLQGWPSLPAAGWGTPQHWIMPVIVLSAASMGYITRLTRSTMLD